jgi:hypothetical protein
LNWFHISVNPHVARCKATNAICLIDKFHKNVNKIKERFRESATSRFAPVSIDMINGTFWDRLNLNSSSYAMNLLLQNPDKIYWKFLSQNPHPIAISLLSQSNKIDYENLKLNPNGLHILKKQLPHYWINSFNLCSNPGAIDIIKKEVWDINWRGLTTNAAAIDMIMTPKNLEENFYFLCANSAAIDYLKNNQNKIDWIYMSHNTAIIEPDDKCYAAYKSAWTKCIYCLDGES